MNKNNRYEKLSKKTNLEEMKMQLNRIEHYIRISTEKKYFPSPASECTCREFYIKPCPLHPYDLKVEIKKDSEPPLKAQVAEALGWEAISGTPIRGYAGVFKGEVKMIPPYDTDIKLAMGALEKYREMHYPDAFPIMILENRYRSYSGGEWTVVIGAKNKQQIIDGIYGDDLEAVDFSIAVNRDGLPVVAADSLPEAVCRAIVKHAEGR